MDFLSCEWRKLAVANYAVNPAILRQFTPHGTEIDLLHGTCYVSLVGFMFLNTRTLGIKIPGHVNFEEVNLRFYVRRRDADGEMKRGVVFIKEIVPKPLLALVARLLYKENYEAMPMRHAWVSKDNALDIDYGWKRNRWNTLRVEASDTSVSIESGSDEEFILEHYWGYSRVSDTKTFEYRVEHPTWQVYPVSGYNIDVDFGDLYGKDFDFLTHAKPISVFLAEGSEVVVKSKRTL